MVKATQPRAGKADRATAKTAKAERTTTLTRESIVATALNLSQREGPAALTLRRLGVEIAVDATAFYRHFRDKDEIVVACLDRVIDMSYEEIENTVAGADWRTALTEVAWASWRMSETHAAIYSLGFARTTGGPGERKMLEMMLGKLAETGMSLQRTVLMYRMFIDTVLSMCGMRAALLCLPPELAEKDEAAWLGVYAVLPQKDYPAARRYAAAMSEISAEKIYATTLDVVLDRIDAETDRSAS